MGRILVNLVSVRKPSSSEMRKGRVTAPSILNTKVKSVTELAGCNGNCRLETVAETLPGRSRNQHVFFVSGFRG